MTEKEVIDILGEPLVRWDPYGNTVVGFQYSESPTSTNYSLRQVYIQNGKLVEVIGYFYLD